MTDLACDREALLIRKARTGESGAFTELVKTYNEVAYRMASYIAGPNDAEEVTQLAFIKAYYALGRFQIGRPFQPWLLRIVVNEARTARRGEKRRSAIFTRALSQVGPSHGDSQLEQRAVQAEEHAELEAALARLPDKHRDVVTCRYLLELSEEETARVLGLRAGTVKSRLSRALDSLRTELDRPRTDGRAHGSFQHATQQTG